jgi:hypothetical protein
VITGEILARSPKISTPKRFGTRPPSMSRRKEALAGGVRGA